MAQLIEGIIVSKETGLRASFAGTEQPYVRCTVALRADPERHVEARVVGLEDLPAGVGGFVRLEVTRVVTDRREGVVRFDCSLVEARE